MKIVTGEFAFLYLLSSDRGVITDGGEGIVTECGPEESPVQAVIRGVAAVKGVDPTNLEPLSRGIEPDALEALMDRADEQRHPVGVEFTFDEYVVLVRSDGRIRIDEGPPRTIPTAGEK